jgi:signal transduction histidine kinase/CheY-like chemotaxis protein
VRLDRSKVLVLPRVIDAARFVDDSAFHQRQPHAMNSLNATTNDASGARAVLVLDGDGRIARWNVAAEIATGHRASALAGRSLGELFQTDAPATHSLPVLLMQVRVQGSAQADGMLTTGTGRRIGARLRIDAIAPVAGNESSYIASIDLRASDSLAPDSAQDTVDRAVKEAVERLAAGMAHRFNNVLAAILGSLEVLCHRLPVPQRAATLVDTALRAAARGSALTHDLLTYAQIQQLNPQATNVRDIVRHAAERIQAACTPNIAVSTQVIGEVPALLADPEELIGALVHLGENARDAMPAGGEIRIEARVARAESGDALAPGDYVRFAVIDRGHGIGADIRAHVAEPFFTTRGMAEHLGMGLSTVQGFVSQCRGRLAIDSVVGQGTTAEIWLPIRDPASAQPSSGTATTQEWRAATVLLVDDDELVLLSTSGLLEELGWHVLSANGGSQALDIIAAHPEIDVVLTDHIMPGMTGMELAHAIRYARPDLPVVLTSGGDVGATNTVLPETVKRLVKPYGAQELAAALRRAAH